MYTNVYRDTGVNAIESLMMKKGAFDYILLETTGLADPGNLAPLFWVDDGLGSSIYLDGIVTLVDAKNILKSLDDESGKVDGHEQDERGPVMTTAHVQISHADVIVINKADLVTEAELQQVKDRISSINGVAKLHITERSEVPKLEGLLLDLHAYDQFQEPEPKTQLHSHLDPVRVELTMHGPLYFADTICFSSQTISTVTVPFSALKTEQLDKVDKWLREILWDARLPGSDADQKFEIHRSKGRLVFKDGSVKLLQGVREIFELIDIQEEGDDGDRKATVGDGKIIFIGRNVAGVDFKKSFDGFVG